MGTAIEIKLEKHALEILRWAVRKYHPKICLSCSFGKDSSVILSMVSKIKQTVPVIYINTGLEFKETLRFKDKMVEEYRLNLIEVKPITPYEALVKDIGQDIYSTNPQLCCDTLKVEPMKRALRGFDAWITGLRRDETEFRRNIKVVERFDGIVKVNPLALWTEKDVWRYIFENNLPYNPLYNKGYRSLGCMPCTKKGRWGQFERAGRWRGTSKEGGECGIHTFKKLK
jgi:phosphoadenosine phosphosulfate reductase